jgi:hypothetical protein
MFYFTAGTMNEDDFCGDDERLNVLFYSRDDERG